MNPRTALAIGQPVPARLRLPSPLGASAALSVGLLLVLGPNCACAAALGGLAGSAGMLAALTTLILMQGWAAHLPASGVYATGGVLLVAGALVWLWRAHPARRALGFAGTAVPMHAGTPPQGPIRRVPPAAVITLPAGVEQLALLAELRRMFVSLQAAWDLAELPSLRELTTPEMFDELCFESPCNAAVRAPSRTDVVTLRAELIDFEVLAGMQLASVEFSGLIREAADHGAVPFREFWILARSNAGDSGWRLARHQALL